MERYFKKVSTLPNNFDLDDLTEGQKIAFKKFQEGDVIEVYEIREVKRKLVLT